MNNFRSSLKIEQPNYEDNKIIDTCIDNTVSHILELVNTTDILSDDNRLEFKRRLAQRLTEELLKDSLGNDIER